MKKILHITAILILMMLNLHCSRNREKIIVESVSNDSLEHYMEFETISDKDLWLRADASSLHSDLTRRLADAYNASVVMNSIMTDFDLQMRGYDTDDVIMAVKGIDVTKVKDAEVQFKLKDYKEEMLYLLSVEVDTVDQNIHNPWKAYYELYDYLSEKYNVKTFADFDEEQYWQEYNNCPSVPDWKQLKEKRGDGSLVEDLKKKLQSADDFDARCIYAIELAHAYEADFDLWGEDFLNPAIPIMESVMKEKKYSLYLNELWQKWRVLYQDSEGASRDSEIPNRLYNDYRNICVCTILSYIEEHPHDIWAINECLVMSCKENIFRGGVFEYGNQAIVEKYYLFPEKYDKEKMEN